MEEELEFIIESTQESMSNAINHLEKKLINIRAGKASPSMLGSVTVEYYGSLTPLSQVANVNTPDGRTIVVQPWEKSLLADIEKEIFNNHIVPSREEVIENLIPYIKDELKKGTRLNQIMRHTLGLFHGQTGSSYWKRYLSENMCVRNADIQKVDHIMDKIKLNSTQRIVGRSA